jgi:hypothetical protein
MKGGVLLGAGFSVLLLSRLNSSLPTFPYRGVAEDLPPDVARLERRGRPKKHAKR